MFWWGDRAGVSNRSSARANRRLNGGAILQCKQAMRGASRGCPARQPERPQSKTATADHAVRPPRCRHDSARPAAHTKKLADFTTNQPTMGYAERRHQTIQTPPARIRSIFRLVTTSGPTFGSGHAEKLITSAPVGGTMGVTNRLTFHSARTAGGLSRAQPLGGAHEGALAVERPAVRFRSHFA